MLVKGVFQMEHKDLSSIKPSFLGSLSVILFLCITLTVQVILYGSPEIHTTIIFSCTYAIIVAMASGFKWKTIEEGIMHGCKLAMIPMLILMLIGVLIPTWIAAGTIPTLIYYGLKIISPTFFLLTTALVCAVASVATGSSWTTGATFGVACMGISVGLGIPAPMTAGAVISGAILGDKMSPLSDSTNLAAGVSEANLFDHIRSMTYTTGPAFVISLIIFTILGFQFSGGAVDTTAITNILGGIQSSFKMTPMSSILSLIPLVIVVVLAVKNVSGVAVMVIASLVGLALAVIVQGRGLYEMMNFMNYGFVIETGTETVDKLFNRGGLQSMMWTVSLGFLGLSFGGILEKTRMLEVLLEKMSGLVRKQGNLILTHVISTIAVNVFSASQYMAILIPGRMFLPAYKKLGIKNMVCSRTCEDSGTVTSPLVPWGLCGVFFAGTLGVSTMEYLPYTYLALITPLVAVIYGYTGLFIFKEEKEEIKNDKQSPADM
ncbi:MAG: NhaC family Na+:H+ antiporter [Clostridium sp.]|jgi:NhaC family Na+:H+ antiporter